ncbi:MAG TPA: amidohydrolase, partial [Xanthomonadales bacterium]|nr:amidohydrolase [Xanthomonadales bacterium]
AHAGARTLDFGAATVVPGLIDAHGHLLGLGLGLAQANLVGTTSKADVIARLRSQEKMLEAGEWLLGRGWDQNDWPEKVFPTAADLDAAFPDRPVWIERVDGHAGWANSAAMKRVKRDLGGDWQPGGGRIERAGGKPTGIFVDGAMALVDNVVAQASPDTAREALFRAMSEAAKLGLTGVHDAGVSAGTLALYRELADAKRLPIRVYAMADGDADALAALCRDGLYRHAGGRLEMRAVKLYADGALGSRGAALDEDYSDDQGNRGLLVTEPPALAKAIGTAKRCGVQVAVHAIGDRGNREVLDAFAKAQPGAERRWRIEHAQVVRLADIPRFRELGVIASMQPTHATSDMPWAEDRVGPDRVLGAYAWRRFRDAGVRLAFGSDFPVEAVNPMYGLHSAVTRQDEKGEPRGGWYPNERVTAYEALRGFTLDAAYAGFAEKDLGSISAGKRADFVVLSADPIDAAPQALRGIAVLATYVDGVAVYTRPAR